MVLNGVKANIRVSEQTRQRILTAAAELEYSPNPVAQSLQRRRSGTIAYVYHSLTNSLYERAVPYQLGRLIMRAAVSHGFQVIEVNSTAYQAANGDEVLRLLRSRRVDGVILGWPKDRSEVSRIVDHGLPVVQVMKPQPVEGSSTITVDSLPGFNAAVEHLAELGHKHIAYLGSGDPHPVERARSDCFIRALKRHEFNAHEEYIMLGDDYSVAEGFKLMHSILALPKRPSAVLMIDSLTLGGLRALYDTRIWVPDDMSVISSDDLLAAHLYPPLTTVVQPLEEVADCAVALLEEQALDVNGEDFKPAHIILPTSLKVRDSTRTR